MVLYPAAKVEVCSFTPTVGKVEVGCEFVVGEVAAGLGGLVCVGYCFDGLIFHVVGDWAGGLGGGIGWLCGVELRDLKHFKWADGALYRYPPPQTEGASLVAKRNTCKRNVTRKYLERDLQTECANRMRRRNV